MKTKPSIETGVKFYVIDTDTTFHSFEDFNLILAPFVLPPAQPKINLLDIEGMDGSLDLTEANGEVRYYDRSLKFTFTVFPVDEMSFEERQTFVSNALNGKRCKITLDKDPEYYFIGRCTVNEHLCDRRLQQIVVTATVSPYKMLVSETVASYDLKGAKEDIVVENRRKSVIPIITCTENCTITLDSKSHDIDGGKEYKILDFQLKYGNNIFTITGTGTGTITFTYQEGDL